MAVEIEAKDYVTKVISKRPEAKNATDRETATAVRTRLATAGKPGQ